MNTPEGCGGKNGCQEKEKAAQNDSERLELSSGDPRGTRTPVAGVRGRSPRPLDDGAMIVEEFLH